MIDRQTVERIALEVMAEHHCHTAILYGSHARGDMTEHSDIDLIFISGSGDVMVRDARILEGVYLDAFIYPEAVLGQRESSLLHIRNGIVIRERDGFGSALLARLQRMYDAGPPKQAEDERRAIICWSQKMLERVRGQHGLEADYRRMQLLVQAVEDYFVLRDMWFNGPKAAFVWLANNDPSTHRLYERAARLGASDDALIDLVNAIYKPI